MSRITNIKSLSSNIYKEYATISFIEIEDPSFNSGNFGEVYHCKSINGKPCPVPQVIKIIFDAHAKKNHLTIQKLQRLISDKVLELDKQNIRFEDEYPALVGCPQFSFEGSLNGKTVLGYSANNLKSLGFDEFGEILEDDKLIEKYQKLRLPQKLNIAYQLVKAFNLLRSFLYIHADFKADALFVNMNKEQCAIIDFDSGAVMQSPNDSPTTWGTTQDWLAPEIIEQYAKGLNNRKKANDLISVEVNLSSDMWSVAICIYYIIFTFHPYTFFTEITKRSIEDFHKTGANYPNIDTSSVFFDSKKNEIFKNTRKYFYNKLPHRLQEKLSHTLSVGCVNPSQRVTYEQWKLVLQSSQTPPKIQSLSVDRNIVNDKKPIIVSWVVSNTSFLMLNNQNVIGKNNHSLQIKADTTLTLVAKNSLGEDKKSIQIKVLKEKPIIHLFTSDVPNNSIENQAPITLNWNVEKYEKIEIDNGIGDVTGTQSIKINPPRKAIIYTLRATSYFGEVTTALLNLTVNPDSPKINDFTSDAPNNLVQKQAPIKLSWNVKNYEKIEINNGIGDVTNLQSIEVNPPRKAITYKLRATSYFGEVATALLSLTVNPHPPRINYFNPSTNVVLDAKSPVVLSWNISNASEIIINQGIGDVSNKKSVEVFPKRDTIYIIEATSYFGVVATQKITVTVPKIPPVIKEFNADKLFFNKPEETTLFWEVQGAEELFISPDIGDVSNLESVNYTVTKGIELTLRAVSYFGEPTETKLLLQAVEVPPLIKSFNADKIWAKDNTPTMLSWEVERAEQIYLDNGIGNVQPIGQMDVTIMKDTTFIITAISCFGVISKRHCRVQISKIPPQIIWFRAGKAIIEKGDFTYLFWQVDNALKIEIDNNIGEVASSGKLKIVPETDTTYTLTAENHFGYQSKMHVYIYTKNLFLNKGTQLNAVPQFKKNKPFP